MLIVALIGLDFNMIAIGSMIRARSSFGASDLVIGMTSHVPEGVIESRQMRRLATLHGLQLFLVNPGALALTIKACRRGCDPILRR